MALVFVGYHAIDAMAQAPTGNACVAAKNLAAAQYYRCRARERSKTVPSATLDFATCERKLAAAFARAERRPGGCPDPTMDLSTLRLRVEAADESIERILLPQPPVYMAQRRCADTRRRFLAKYVRCEASEREEQLLQTEDLYRRCHSDLVLSLYAGNDRFGEFCETPHTWDVVYAVSTACSQLTGARLSGVTFGAVDLFGADLVGADLSGSDLSSVSLENANLDGADLRDAIFDNTDFGAASLRGANLSRVQGEGGVSFLSANLDGATLADAHFGSASSFQNASLVGADFSGTELDGAYFDDANLAGVDFSTSSFRHISSARLPTCPIGLPPEWVCVSGTLLGPTASLLDPVFDGMNLDGLNLTESSFGFASFAGTSLVGVNFTRAGLSGVRFAGADLSGADLTDANTFATDFDLADLSGANLTGVDLRFVYIAGADLTGVIWGVTRCDDGSLSTARIPETCCGTFGPGGPAACSP